jgi:hypothetical protein
MKTTAPKTILIAGSQGGGQFKSTTIATLADALQIIGHSTKTIAIDHGGKPMLQKLCPDTVHVSLSDGAVGAYEAAYKFPADITIIDSPSCYAENLADSTFLIPPEAGGARIVVGVIVNTQSEHSLECGVQFAYPFAPYSPEYIVLAVHDGASNKNVLKSPGGKLLTELAEGRVIEFPAFSQLLRQQHNDRPAVPSVHIAQAANPISALPWKRYQAEVLESVSRHAEWLIGKKSQSPGCPS